MRHQVNQAKINTGISAIILAAGESKRMGKPKLMLPFGKVSMIEMVVTNTLHSAIDKTLVVLGANKPAIENLLQEYPVEIVFNENYKRGMFSSVQLGIQAIPEISEAVMVLLGDQPMIGNTIMNQLIKTYKDSKKEIIVATFNKMRGHPILLGHKYVEIINNFPTEKSLKDILQEYSWDIEEMETGNPEILRDIEIGRASCRERV